MIKEKTLKRPILSFVVLSSVIFLVFFTLIGIGMMLGLPKIATHILQIISAWSSTFALMILFKRIYPRLKFKELVKKQFAIKLKPHVIITAIIVQLLIFIVTLIMLSNGGYTQNFTFSLTGVGLLTVRFFTTLVSGPLGEELGWRAFALNELQKKYSPLKTALITGTLWGFWHTPLWLVSGYTGIDLIKYIVVFMIAIISTTIIITIFYNLNKNLLIPIVIHQLFNFLISIPKGELIDILSYTSIAYFAVAIILIIINPNKILYKNREQVANNLM